MAANKSVDAKDAKEKQERSQRNAVVLNGKWEIARFLPTDL
jgi:hypothetical protein